MAMHTLTQSAQHRTAIENNNEKVGMKLNSFEIPSIMYASVSNSKSWKSIVCTLKFTRTFRKSEIGEGAKHMKWNEQRKWMSTKIKQMNKSSIFCYSHRVYICIHIEQQYSKPSIEIVRLFSLSLHFWSLPSSVMLLLLLLSLLSLSRLKRFRDVVDFRLLSLLRSYRFCFIDIMRFTFM